MSVIPSQNPGRVRVRLGRLAHRKDSRSLQAGPPRRVGLAAQTWTLDSDSDSDSANVPYRASARTVTSLILPVILAQTPKLTGQIWV